MSNKIEIHSRVSFVSRAARALRKLARNTRGAELVEVLVVIVIFALGGKLAMDTLSKGVNNAAGKVEGKVNEALGM